VELPGHAALLPTPRIDSHRNGAAIAAGRRERRRHFERAPLDAPASNWWDVGVSTGGRGRARQRIVRRAGWIAGGLVLLALLLLLTGHWVVGVVLGAVAAVAVWVFLQARAVR
jgi:hypothetical protein